jgi:Arc/MetJ-type ribon-helix-helix transcriptional regulator
MSRKKSLIEQDAKQKVEVWMYPEDRANMDAILETGHYPDKSAVVRYAVRKLAEDIVAAMTPKKDTDTADAVRKLAEEIVAAMAHKKDTEAAVRDTLRGLADEAIAKTEKQSTTRKVKAKAGNY